MTRQLARPTRPLKRALALVPAVGLLALAAAGTAGADSAKVLDVTPRNPNNGQATYAVNLSMTVTDCGTSKSCSWFGVAKVMPVSEACGSGRTSARSRYVWLGDSHSGPGSTSGSGTFTPLPSSLGDPPWRICIYKSALEYTTLADYTYTPPETALPDDSAKIGEIQPVLRNRRTEYSAEITVTVNNCEGSSACAWFWDAMAMPASSTCDTGRTSPRSTYIVVGPAALGAGTSSASGSFSAGTSGTGLGNPPWRICVYKHLGQAKTLLDQLYTPPKTGAVPWVTPHVTMTWQRGRYRSIRLIGMNINLPKGQELTMTCTQACPAGVDELASITGNGSEQERRWSRFRPSRDTRLQVTIKSEEQLGARRKYRVGLTPRKPMLQQVGAQVCLKAGSSTETVTCPS